MDNPLVVVFFVILAVGFLACAAVGLAVFSLLWWIIIPLGFACLAGPLGFFFGVGLVLTIFMIGSVLNACRKPSSALKLSQKGLNKTNSTA